MKISTILLFASLFFICTAFDLKPDQGDLIIQVNNVKKIQGKVWIGIYDSKKNFMVREKAIVQGFEVSSTGILVCKVPQLPFGTYAIAVFHDLNNNGELDTSFIGIPKEPYGFSVKPRSKWRIPRFHEVKFDFKEIDQILQIRIEKW